MRDSEIKTLSITKGALFMSRRKTSRSEQLSAAKASAWPVDASALCPRSLPLRIWRWISRVQPPVARSDSTGGRLTSCAWSCWKAGLPRCQTPARQGIQCLAVDMIQFMRRSKKLLTKRKCCIYAHKNRILFQKGQYALSPRISIIWKLFLIFSIFCFRFSYKIRGCCKIKTR